MKTLVTIIILISIHYHLVAQEVDTVEVKVIEISDDIPTSSVAITRVKNADLKIIAPIQVSEVLSTVPGLFIRDFGGLGGLKSVSIRGGASAQSLVMLDGIRLNSTQNGSIDLSTIPAGFISDIEVIKGSVTAIVGANAMSGAVNLNLWLGESNQVSALVSGGSFNETRGKFSGVLNVGNIKIGSSLERYTTDGSFSYTIESDGQPTEITRSNADVTSTSAMFRVEFDSLTTMMVVARRGERGVPGAVIQGAATTSVARLDEFDLYGYAKSGNYVSKQALVMYGVASRYIDQQYVDRQSTITGPGGVDVRYINRDVSSFASLSVTSLSFKHDWRVDAGYVTVSGETLQTTDGKRPERFSYDGQYKLTWREPESPLTGELAISGDYFTDVGGAVSAFAGASFQMINNLTIRGNVGSGFRPPSFNELYYLNYGTSSLRPERSYTASAGSVYTIKLFDELPIGFTADVYFSRIFDLIVSVPINPVTVSAQNVGSAQSLGLELSASTKMLSNRLFIDWNYTLQKVTDKTGRNGLDGTLIPYTPMEMFAVSAVWNENTLYSRMQWSYTSFRYAQAGEEYSSLLPGYHIVNLVVGAKAKGAVFNADISLHLDNVFDTRYSVVRGYPMPGRLARIVVAVQP